MPTKKKSKSDKMLSSNGREPIAVVEKARRGPKGFTMPVGLAEGFGQLGLTQADIADFLKVSRKTVEREFQKQDDSEFVREYRKGRASTNRSLRMKLLQRALREDRDSLLQFALKNYCNMKDTAEIDHQGQISVNVTMGGEVVKQPKWMHN
jgi:hypothetical protein